MKTMGQRIRDKRKAAKLNQKQLASAVGVSHVTISQWESDTTSPKGKNLNRLCKVFGCTENWMLFGDQGVGKNDSIDQALSVVRQRLEAAAKEDREALTSALMLLCGKSPQGK